jgi:dTDP-4-amino-4,6-dideoxygalactose transaminase
MSVRVPFLDIPAQHRELQTEIEETVIGILRSGAYVVGVHNREFEKEMAALHGVEHAVAVNSGTDALKIAMEAMGLKCGDEVITTPFSFVATIETMVQIGVKPVFVDIDPAHFMIDPALVEAAITPKTKAICPIHLFGQLCDVDALTDIAKRHNLLILEDAAQAILSHHEGVYAGNFGVAAGLSFYVTKNLGAAGDGGMILTNDADVADRSRSLRIHGMGRERYYYDGIGYTSRLDEIQAAILRLKLTRLEAWTERRQSVAARYAAGISNPDVILPVTLDGNNHSWHQYTVRCKRRDHLQAFLKERQIDSMIYYPVPLHYHEPYRFLGYKPGDFPRTEQACLEVLSLPVHQDLTDEQVEAVIAAVNAFV